MTTQDLFRLIEIQSGTVNDLIKIAEMLRHRIELNEKDIEALQDRVDELESKLISENRNNLGELFASMNPKNNEL